MKTYFACIVSCCAGLLLTCGSAGASVIYQTGFESPTFSPGVIGGQGTWVDNNSGNALVQSPVAASGSQALLLQHTGFDFADKFFDAPGAGKVFTFAVDHLHSGTGGQSGMGAYGDDERFIANVGYRDGGLFAGNRNASSATPIPAVNNVWYHLVLTLDFNTLTTYGTANGESLGAPLPMILPTSGVIPAAWTKLMLVGIQTTGGENMHYYDNLVISSVPEPQAAALLGTAALGVFRRRRALRA